jgi:PKD repeat protein
MNADYLFTRRRFGMDSRVWVTLLLVCMLSLAFYSYTEIKHDAPNAENCPTDSILINGQRISVLNTCYTNRYSSFEFPAGSRGRIEWDFGDETDVEKDPVVSHRFMLEGTYHVKATLNGNCNYDFLVEVVDNSIFSGNTVKPVIEVYADPMRPTVGSTVKFYCVADIPSITSYQWKVSGTNTVKKNDVPAYIFDNEGNYTIELVLNNDSSLTTRAVVVVAGKTTGYDEPAIAAGPGGLPPDIGRLVNIDSPGERQSNNEDQPITGSSRNDQGPAKQGADSAKAVTPPGAPEIDPVAFQDLLQNVVNEDGKEVEDLYEYLDYKASTKVKVNENKSMQSIIEFCKNMRERRKKKRQITSVTFNRDDKKSIQIINVKISENESFFQRINPFN